MKKYRSFDLDLFAIESRHPDVRVCESENPKIAYLLDAYGKVGIMVRKKSNGIVMTMEEAKTIAAELPGILDAAPYYR